MYTTCVKSLLLLCLGASLVQVVYTQQCESITSGDLVGPIVESIDVGGEVTSDAPSVTVIEINIVCEAQATNKDRYRFTSVVVSFNCSSSDTNVALCNNASTVHTMQFDLGCTNTDWSVNYLGSSTSFSTENPTATLSTGLDSQCAACVNPDHIYITLRSTSVSDDTHCEACRGCTEGMGRCTIFNNDPGEDCCNYFDEDICVGECPGTLVGGSDFECRCSVLSDDNGVITFSNNQETDSVATLTCNTGYEGTDTVVCTGTGWTNVPTCTPVQCPQLDSIENGELTLTNSNNFNSMATYTCNSVYLLEGDSSGTCMSDRTWSHTPPSCTPCDSKITGCLKCSLDDKNDVICEQCPPGQKVTDMECKDEETATSPPQTSSCDIACIIGIILAILAVIIITIVVIVVAFVLYKYLNDPATKLAKTDTEGLNGVARDNPLYVDPAAVTEEGVDGGEVENGVSETTPLDASGDSA